MKRFFQFVIRSGIWAPGLVLVLHEVVFIKAWRTQVDWFNHYAGGLSFTYFAWKSLPYFTRLLGKPTAVGRVVCAFFMGCTAALLWDIVEFSSDLFFHTNIQKSLPETMMDLVNGFLGTTTTAVILAFLTCRPSKQDCAIEPGR